MKLCFASLLFVDDVIGRFSVIDAAPQDDDDAVTSPREDSSLMELFRSVGH